MELKGKRVLITGGCGFIGSNLAQRLVVEGSDVTLVDSLIPSYGGNLFNVRNIREKVSINLSDVRDKYSLKALLKDQDYLFNLAGQTSHMDSMENPMVDLEINCKAQLSILEICREINPNIKIVFASTRQIYGRPSGLPVSEGHDVVPVDINGIHKWSGEQYHILYQKVYGISTTCLRLTNTIGPHMRIKDARQTFYGVWVKQLLQGKPIEVWGGQQIRDFTYVDDCVRALILAAVTSGCEGKSFNIGGPRTSLLDLAKMSIKVNGGGELIIKEFPKDREKIDIGDYYSDDSAFKKATGWKPTVELEEMVHRILSFFRKYSNHYL